MPVNLRIGSVFKRSFQILFRNIVGFGLLVFSINLAIYFFVGIFVQSPWVDVAHELCSLILLFVVTAVLTFGVLQNLRGRSATIFQCLAYGFSVMMPVVGVALSLVAAYAAVSAPLGALIGLYFTVPKMAAISPPLSIFIHLLGIGAILAIATIYARWFVAIPVVVSEKRGALKSLKRSAQLTRGSRWRVLGIGGVTFVAAWAIRYGIAYGTTIVTELLTVQDWSFGTLTIEGFVDLAFGSLDTVFSAILMAVVYHDLRIAKDGIDTEEIAKVFD